MRTYQRNTNFVFEFCREKEPPAPKSKPQPSVPKKPVGQDSSDTERKNEKDQPENEDSNDEEIGKRRNKRLAKRLEKSANETLKFLEDIENKKKARNTAVSASILEAVKANDAESDAEKGKRRLSKDEKTVICSKGDQIRVDLKFKNKDKGEKAEVKAKVTETEEDASDGKAKSDTAKAKEDPAKARKGRSFIVILDRTVKEGFNEACRLLLLLKGVLLKGVTFKVTPLSGCVA